MYQENLVNKRRCNKVFILASLFVLASLLHVPGCGAEQCSTESSVSEYSLEKDQIQAHIIRNHPSQFVESCAVKKDDEKDTSEVCGEDPYLADVDGVTSSSSDDCETLTSLQEEEKVKYSECSNAPQKHQDETLMHAHDLKKDAHFSVSNDLLRRSFQGLEDMLGQVEKSSVNVFEKLGGVIDQVGLSREQVMKSLDTVMDRVSESVSESKVRVIKSIDSLMDQVSASKTKMMEELDHVIDKVAHSKVIEEIRALPGEIRESVVLNVRNRSYIAAGIMVAITTAILVAGAVYCAWCHHDAWSYQRYSIEELTPFRDYVNTATGVNYGAVLNNGTSYDVTKLLNRYAVNDVGVDKDGDKDEGGEPSSPGHEVIEGYTQEEKKLENLDLQKFSLTHSFAFFSPEVGGTHEAKLKEILEDKMSHECEQENVSNTCEHWKNTPQKSEPQGGPADLGFDKDKSSILAPKNLLCSFECSSASYMTVNSLASDISSSKSALSGLIPDSIWHKEMTVHVSQSCQEQSGKPITDSENHQLRQAQHWS